MSHRIGSSKLGVTSLAKGCRLVSADYITLHKDALRPSEEFRILHTRFELLQRVAAIVEYSDDAIISQTIDGIITSWNSGAERIFGYAAHEMIDQPIFRLACRGDDDMVKILDQIRNGTRVDHYEAVRRSKDGRDIPVSLTVSPIRNSSGETIGSSQIARDISTQKSAEKAERVAEKLAAAGRLASSIAHDINNPLAAITNLLFLLENERLSDTGKHYLATAQREMSRLAHITGQALGFYRNSGKIVLLSMETIADEALALHHHRCVASGIDVSREYETAPQIYCHPGELRQVIVNLIGNALDAMSSGGRLRLKIRKATDWLTGRQGLRFTVADTGSGMNAETRQRLFEPFYTTKKVTGTGLGLWVCVDIAAKYEGRISMRSDDKPRRNGSVFMLFLPL
jgi:PAS domain S-box-containing protein